jgi:hypothetical protein
MSHASPNQTPSWEALVVRMAREDFGWGYDRIVEAALLSVATG